MTYIFHKASRQTATELYQGTMPNSATTVYSPGTDEEVEITSIVISNTANVDRWFSLWIDQDGTTYSDATILYHEIDVEFGTTLVLDTPMFMNDATGNLAVQGENNTDLNITIFGIITDIS